VLVASREDLPAWWTRPTLIYPANRNERALGSLEWVVTSRTTVMLEPHRKATLERANHAETVLVVHEVNERPLRRAASRDEKSSSNSNSTFQAATTSPIPRASAASAEELVERAQSGTRITSKAKNVCLAFFAGVADVRAHRLLLTLSPASPDALAFGRPGRRTPGVSGGGATKEVQPEWRRPFSSRARAPR
jgi:hypothetical protein